MEALKGKVVLLDFWTFCCINCLHILEELKPLEERFRNALVVIGVHSPKFEHERDHEALKRAVARYDVCHLVLDGPDRATWDQYGSAPGPPSSSWIPPATPSPPSPVKATAPPWSG